MDLTPDTAIQAVFLLLTLGILFAVFNLPRKALTKLRSKNRATIQSNRHFLTGANLLSRARSTRNKTTSTSLSKDALSEADKAIALQPREPSAHILRALALDHLGQRASALRSLDVALTSPAVKLLSEREKGDALVKRAEIMLAVNKRRRVDSALSDLVDAVELVVDNSKAFCLLGQCYEFKGLKDEAVDAFHKGLELDPGCSLAREGLDRLKS